MSLWHAWRSATPCWGRGASAVQKKPSPQAPDHDCLRTLHHWLRSLSTCVMTTYWWWVTNVFKSCPFWGSIHSLHSLCAHKASVWVKMTHSEDNFFSFLCNDLNRVDQRIVCTELPKLDSVYSNRIIKKAHNIHRDCTHPGHFLFKPLPSGKRFRTIKTKTKRKQFLP